MTVAWLIGGRGLLGTSIDAAIAHRPDWHRVPTAPLPWNEPDQMEVALRSGTAALLEACSDEPWTIIWAAGSTVTTSSADQFDQELRELSKSLAIIGELAGGSDHGSIFFASSAGGVYGGSASPPFNEETEPSPLSGYGHFKLDAESLIESFAASHGLSSLVGRIANLYGPGQSLEKAQGLISHLARAQYSTAPAGIYVSLDTMRDYLFAPDCAQLILDALDRLHSRPEGGPTQVTKILASGQPVTIGTLLGHFRWITKSAPHVMLGQSPAATLQATDLRLRSVVWPDLDARELTPLPAGIRSTIDGILSGIQSGDAASMGRV